MVSKLTGCVYNLSISKKKKIYIYDDDDVKKIEGMNYERKKIKTYIYLRAAWALSIVTLSLVASRLVRPRSKYLISNSTKGNISCGESIQNLHNTQEKKKEMNYELRM